MAPGEFSSGNSWLTDESIHEQAKDMWRQMHKEQRNSYGEDYFETAVRSLERFTTPQVSMNQWQELYGLTCFGQVNSKNVLFITNMNIINYFFIL